MWAPKPVAEEKKKSETLFVQQQYPESLSSSSRQPQAPSSFPFQANPNHRRLISLSSPQEAHCWRHDRGSSYPPWPQPHRPLKPHDLLISFYIYINIPLFFLDCYSTQSWTLSHLSSHAMCILSIPQQSNAVFLAALVKHNPQIFANFNSEVVTIPKEEFTFKNGVRPLVKDLNKLAVMGCRLLLLSTARSHTSILSLGRSISEYQGSQGR